MTYLLTYLGETIDAFDTRTEAVTHRAVLVSQIMNDEIPHFLDSGDFEDAADCLASFIIVAYDEGQIVPLP